MKFNLPRKESLVRLEESEPLRSGEGFMSVFPSCPLLTLVRATGPFLACGVTRGGNPVCALRTVDEPLASGLSFSFSVTTAGPLVPGLVFPGASVSTGLKGEMCKGLLGEVDADIPDT